METDTTVMGGYTYNIPYIIFLCLLRNTEDPEKVFSVSFTTLFGFLPNLCHFSINTRAKKIKDTNGLKPFFHFYWVSPLKD